MPTKLHLHMQFFADTGTPPPATETAMPAPTEVPDQPKPLTAEDIKTMITEHIGDVTKIMDNKLTESQKLAQMSADEKAQYEQQQRTTDIEQREQELTKRELMATAKDTLTQKGVPQSLAALLDYTNADNCTKSIELLESEYKTAVAAGINDAMKGTTPKIGNNPATAISGLRAAMGLQ